VKVDYIILNWKGMNLMKKILICGGRNYNNYEKIKEIIKEIRPSCIVQGGANGADFLAKKSAKELKIECKEYKAEWKKYGKKAGVIRNRLMLDENPDIEIVIAFHEDIEASKGTKDMINYAIKKGVKIKLEK